MTDEWYYQSLGQEWGPLPFEEIADLARHERLAPDDSVRCGVEGAWVPAGSIVGLFPEPEELTDLSELNFTFGATDAPQAQPAFTVVLNEAESPPARPRPSQWWAQILGEELGPMTLAELRTMAESGSLAGDDRVRQGADGDWLPGSALDELRAAFQIAASAVVLERSTAAGGAGDGHPEPYRSSSNGTAALPPALDEEADEPSPAEAPRRSKKKAGRDEQPWYWRADEGDEQGPFDFDALQHEAASGRLRPNAEVRRGRKGVWAPAVTCPNLLFPASSLMGLGTVREERAAAPMPPAASLPPSTASAAVSVAKAANGAPPMPEPLPRPALSPAPSLAPRPKAAAKRPKMSFNFDFGGLSERLGENKNAIIVLAVLALIILFIYAPISFGPSDQAYYDKYKAFLTEFEQLRASGASDAEWTAFTDRVKIENDRLVKELLDAGAGAREPIKQQLFWAGDDYLIPMLGDSRKEASQNEKKFREHLQTALTMINGGAVASPPDESESGDSDERASEDALQGDDGRTGA